MQKYDFEIFDPVKERNEKAYNNGKKGEQIALRDFDEIIFVDRLVDAELNGKPLEIKACQEWQSNGKGRCRGRFVLDKEQHDYLIKNHGYYLFIVFKEDGSNISKLVKAVDVEFKRKISWLSIFHAPQGGENLGR
ncbi:hypothetical protein DRP05_01050 [Archaeoglobales archaeon]|nr:MAG: hypothetical protein DRP05_01050 [Archaeoglobales archaeon]